MRDALPELGIEGRIGVNTGEVLAGTEERLATGDAVNVAARLEQAANPGEVLVGDGDSVAVRTDVAPDSRQMAAISSPMASTSSLMPSISMRRTAPASIG